MSATHDDNEGPISAMYQTVVDVAVAEAVEAEREQCCEDVCPWCRMAANREPGVSRAFIGTTATGWRHRVTNKDRAPSNMECEAAAIRERAAREVDGAKPRAN